MQIWIEMTETLEITQVHETKPTLSQLQKAVGGLIEYCPVQKVGQKIPVPFAGRMVLAEPVDVIANEEGRLMDMNMHLLASYATWGVPIPAMPYMIVGPCVLHVRFDENNLITADYGHQVEKMFGMNQVDLLNALGNDESQNAGKLVPIFDTPIQNFEMRLDSPADYDEEQKRQKLPEGLPEVENLDDAGAFFLGALEAGFLVNPEIGFTFPDGSSAYQSLAHEHAQTLDKLAQKAVLIFKNENFDAWEICFLFQARQSLENHLLMVGEIEEFICVQREKGNLKVASYNEGVLQNEGNEDRTNRRRARSVVMMQETLALMSSTIGQEGAFAIKDNAMPHGWSNYMRHTMTALGGDYHITSAESTVEDMPENLDFLARKKRSEWGNGEGFDIDGDENNDDPFAGLD